MWLNLLSKIITFITPCILICNAVPFSTQETNNVADSAMDYLIRYGWLKVPRLRNDTELLVSIEQPLKSFQKVYGLNVTGIVDNETLSIMKRPRCGVQDNIRTNAGRIRRFVRQGSSWRLGTLKYHVKKYPQPFRKRELLSKQKVDSILAAAFQVWAAHIPLSFTRANSEPFDIELSFEIGNHGDDVIFDGDGNGNGNILAHAGFPSNGGTIHFDDSENWSSTYNTGVSLLYVAAHEVGHSLGLRHSLENNALMFGTHPAFEIPPTLHNDDLLGIKALYGDRVKHQGFNFIKPCSNYPINAITTMPDGYLYVFQSNKIFKLSENLTTQDVTETFRYIPSSVDAVFTWNDTTYIFKKMLYWRLTNMILDDGYPQLMSKAFVGVPPRLDAVFTLNNLIYFIKGHNFWRFDIYDGYGRSGRLSKTITLRKRVDAAINIDGIVYFFFRNEIIHFSGNGFEDGQTSQMHTATYSQTSGLCD